MKDFEGNICNSREVHEELMEYVTGYDKLHHASPLHWLGNPEYLEAKSHSLMVFNFTIAEDRDKFVGYGPIWVFNQCCTITLYEDHLHIFACWNCRSFAHRLCDTPTCLKCRGRDHATNSHPADAPLWCINCKKEYTSNYVNCNHRRHLLGLNPLADTPEAQTATKKTSRNAGKKTPARPKTIILKEKNNTNHVVGLDSNQLLEAINKDCSETPMKL